MCNILLGITGSVAATMTKKIVEQLTTLNLDVRIVATQASLYFWNRDDVDVPVLTDAVEWPGHAYVKDQEVAHIALRDWADTLLIAPLTAHTLGKMAHGLCDNLLTTIVRAWLPHKPMFIAPAMNTQMWLHPVTVQHLLLLSQWYDLHVLDPIEKKLACGDTGIGAMAHIQSIITCVDAVVAGSK